jgi:hypothetical protein
MRIFRLFYTNFVSKKRKPFLPVFPFSVFLFCFFEPGTPPPPEGLGNPGGLGKRSNHFRKKQLQYRLFSIKKAS